MSKYRELAEYLEGGIREGAFAPESFLPGERALCERFNLSRVTVRNGLNLLTEKHLIQPVPGRGYRVASHRRFTARPKTRLIGGVFAGPCLTDNLSLVPHQLSLGISDELEERDYSLVVANSADDLLRERQRIKAMLNRGASGLLVMPAFAGGVWGSQPEDAGNYEWFKGLRAEGLPVVLLDRQLAGSGVPGVYNDDIAGGDAQAQHMIDRGFRRVIYFDFLQARLGHLRTTGYRRAMERNNLKPELIPPLDSVPGLSWNTDPELHRRALDRLLPLLDGDAAIICSPFLAPALERHFPEHRLRGMRVEWICYDFPAALIAGARMPYPCMARPIRRIGDAGVLKLLRLLDGDETAATEEFLPPDIVW